MLPVHGLHRTSAGIWSRSNARMQRVSFLPALSDPPPMENTLRLVDLSPSCKGSPFNLPVEKTFLASIPSMVLDQHAGRRLGKFEAGGSKIRPVRGNSDPGSPTGQGMGRFIALGVLMFRCDSAKTVSLQDREAAWIFNIADGHGRCSTRKKPHTGRTTTATMDVQPNNSTERSRRRRFWISPAATFRGLRSGARAASGCKPGPRGLQPAKRAAQ